MFSVIAHESPFTWSDLCTSVKYVICICGQLNRSYIYRATAGQMCGAASLGECENFLGNCDANTAFFLCRSTYVVVETEYQNDYEIRFLLRQIDRFNVPYFLP